MLSFFLILLAILNIDAQQYKAKFVHVRVSGARKMPVGV